MSTLLVDAPLSDPAYVKIGKLIAGRYEIERVIGRGGFGSVFAARHTGTGQGCALKVLASHPDEDDDLSLRRFFVEAQVTSSLRHPNTIRVFDFGQDDSGLVYIAMELLTGRTLKQELRARRRDGGRVFSEREAIDVGVAVTRSLGEAHAAGLVHRDLKADNVFLHHVEDDDPVIKVLDFGIVKLANSGLTRASTSGGPGTPAYMSPEQALNRPDLDGRSDLYSLGVIMWQMVSGKVPFRGEGDVQTLYMHAHDPLPSLRSRAKVPLSQSFVELVERVLSKRPADRFTDAKTMRVALRRCIDATPTAMSAFISHPSLPSVGEAEQETLHTTPVIDGALDRSRRPPPIPKSQQASAFDQPLEIATVEDKASGGFPVGLIAFSIGLFAFLIAVLVVFLTSSGGQSTTAPKPIAPIPITPAVESTVAPEVPPAAPAVVSPPPTEPAPESEPEPELADDSLPEEPAPSALEPEPAEVEEALTPAKRRRMKRNKEQQKKEEILDLKI